MKINSKQMTLSALLAALGIILSMVENLIPPVFVFAPGAKLGIANIVTVVALFSLPLYQVMMIVIVRVTAASLLSGTMNSFMYSLAGALVSLAVMVLVKQMGPKRVSIIGISVMGGIAHNYGQLAIAALLSKSWLAFNYLPFMAISGILAGFLVGIVGNLFLEKLQPRLDEGADFNRWEARS